MASQPRCILQSSYLDFSSGFIALSGTSTQEPRRQLVDRPRPHAQTLQEEFTYSSGNPRARVLRSPNGIART